MVALIKGRPFGSACKSILVLSPHTRIGPFGTRKKRVMIGGGALSAVADDGRLAPFSDARADQICH